MKALLEAKTVVPELTARGDWEAVLMTLHYLVESCPRYDQIGQVEAAILPLFSPADLRDQPELLVLVARVLCAARQPGKLLALVEPLGPGRLRPETEIYAGWAWLSTGQPERTLQVAPDLSRVDPHHLGLYWRFQAEAKARLKQPWRVEMAQAKRWLRGLALGRCLLEEGTLLSIEGHLGAARGSWAEAIGYLGSDPYYQAWANYNIGVALQVSNPARAEHYLLESQRLSSLGAGERFRARALCGLAGVRRLLGDWQRALDTYTRATKAPGDPSDIVEAHWGRGNMLRLIGWPEQALRSFKDALLLQVPGQRWLHVDIAAVNVMLEDTARAYEALEGAGDLGARSQSLKRVVELELRRISGGAVFKSGEPPDLPLQSTWLAHETYCFPALFAELGLLESLRALVPPPVSHNRVEVVASDALGVKVNGRPVALAPRVGELLVRLLESGGQESTETLLEDLYHNQPRHRERNARQALWELADRLRMGLGWEQSVVIAPDLYALDPAALWEYDMTGLPRARWINFMRHLKSDWAEQKRRSALLPDDLEFM